MAKVKPFIQRKKTVYIRWKSGRGGKASPALPLSPAQRTWDREDIGSAWTRRDQNCLHGDQRGLLGFCRILLLSIGMAPEEHTVYRALSPLPALTQPHNWEEDRAHGPVGETWASEKSNDLLSITQVDTTDPAFTLRSFILFPGLFCFFYFWPRPNYQAHDYIYE